MSALVYKSKDLPFFLGGALGTISRTTGSILGFHFNAPFMLNPNMPKEISVAVILT